MKLLITGGSGTLGQEITKLAIANNYQVNILTRNKKLVSNNISLKYYYWNPTEEEIDVECFKGVNSVINLAGFSVFKLWTKKNKKNFRPTKKGAGMTKAGVKAYRRKNPGSKLKTAVTGKVKPGSKDAKRRKSYCARSAGQMKKFPKAAKDPNSRLRQARKRWKC